MTKRDQARLRALTELEAGRLSREEASSVLGVSERQMWRLLGAFRRQGAAGLVHGNRGRRPLHACRPELGDRVAELARTTYAGFNQHHFAEKLATEEGIEISVSTVRRMLAAHDIGAPRPQRRTRHRRRRMRRTQEGALLQLDGSVHDWLEGRGPKFTLIGAIDDATGRIWASFQEAEDSAGYFELLKGIVQENGVPLAIYTDKHAVFGGGSRRTPERVRNGNPLFSSHFTKLLTRLEVMLILARSPQAKGRVERMWRTLQDRLVSELRLNKVQSLSTANFVLQRYVQQHNRLFVIPAHDPEPAWEPWTLPTSIADNFCWSYSRVVSLDNTVRVHGIVLQLDPDPAGLPLARSRVEVRRRLDGSFAVLKGPLSIPFTLFQEHQAA